jgi:c-di-GMP-binding flagellar brake protein YcgR
MCTYQKKCVIYAVEYYKSWGSKMIERRAHTRVYISLPMEYQVQFEDAANAWGSKAVLKNISQGGLYFECENLPELKRGSIGDFTFNTIPPRYSFINSPIKAQAVVKRIESGIAGSSKFGVAVQFLTGPLFGGQA